MHHFDINKSEKVIKGVLYPNIDLKIINSFLEIKTGRECLYGYLIYVGTELSINDVFAKIVEFGKKIETVDFLLHILDNYFKQLSEYKVGAIIKIESVNNIFKLVEYEKTRVNMNKLP